MSWSFEIVAENKAAAQEFVAANEHMPEPLKEIIFSSIAEMSDGAAILVKSNGHVGGQWQHNATFEVRPLTLIKATPPEPIHIAETTTG